MNEFKLPEKQLYSLSKRAQGKAERQIEVYGCELYKYIGDLHEEDQVLCVGEDGMQLLLSGQEAVAYTHLDVYKRQRQALRSLFFTPANVDEKQIHILNEKNYMECEAALAAVGYLDYVVLGLGKDGHFCGNLPHTCTFDDDTHAVACDLNPTLYNRIKFLSKDDENKIDVYKRQQ